MSDVSEAMSPILDSCGAGAENATGAYGVLETIGLTDVCREAMASGTS